MSAVKTQGNGRIVKPEAAGGAVAKKEGGGPSLAGMMQDPKFIAEIQRALPKHITADRIARIVLTALRVTPNLANCTPESFMGCVLQSAQLGLEVNTPMQHAFLIPRRNSRLDCTECTLIIGYQGMIELSMRSGKIAGINAQVVRVGDVFEYELGLDPKLVHKPSGDSDRETKEITHAYAVARIKDAEPVFEVLSAAQLLARSQRSSSGAQGPWTTDPEAMCRKTAARALWKWIPKSPEMAVAESIETAVEVGKTQVSAFAGEVQDALARQGVKPIDTTTYDDETGEIQKQASAAQEPGTSETPVATPTQGSAATAPKEYTQDDHIRALDGIKTVEEVIAWSQALAPFSLNAAQKKHALHLVKLKCDALQVDADAALAAVP